MGRDHYDLLSILPVQCSPRMLEEFINSPNGGSAAKQKSGGVSNLLGFSFAGSMTTSTHKSQMGGPNAGSDDPCGPHGEDAPVFAPCMDENFQGANDAGDIPDDKTLKAMVLERVAKCQAFLNSFLGVLDKRVGKAHRNEKGEFDMGANFDRIGKKIVAPNDKKGNAMFPSNDEKAISNMDGSTRVIIYRTLQTDAAFAGATLSELLHHSREDAVTVMRTSMTRWQN